MRRSLILVVRNLMIRFASFLFILLLAGCTSVPDELWSVEESGCYNKGVINAFLAPDDVGLTDIRIGSYPGTGEGYGTMVHFRRHTAGVFGSERGNPDVLIAVGRGQKSCVVVLDESACPKAIAAYKNLSVVSIPVGFEFDDPTGVTITHGTQFFFSSLDGKSNRLNWSSYGQPHPLQEAISSALHDLAICTEPATAEFERRFLTTQSRGPPWKH